MNVTPEEQVFAVDAGKALTRCRNPCFSKGEVWHGERGTFVGQKGRFGKIKGQVLPNGLSEEAGKKVRKGGWSGKNGCPGRRKGKVSDTRKRVKDCRVSPFWG